MSRPAGWQVVDPTFSAGLEREAKKEIREVRRYYIFKQSHKGKVIKELSQTVSIVNFLVSRFVADLFVEFVRISVSEKYVE